MRLIQRLFGQVAEKLNIFQAEKVNCHIITVPHAILNKLDKIEYNLNILWIP